LNITEENDHGTYRKLKTENILKIFSCLNREYWIGKAKKRDRPGSGGGTIGTP
jgi:hypothetical protein